MELKQTTQLVQEGYLPLAEACEAMGVSLAWGRQMASKGLIAHARNERGRIYIHPDEVARFQAEQELKGSLSVERKEKGFVYTPARITGLKAFIKYANSDPKAPAGTATYASNVLREWIAEWQAQRQAKAAGAEAEAEAEDEGEAAVATPQQPAQPAVRPPVPPVNLADLAQQVKSL